jgi:hypothetical protein
VHQVASVKIRASVNGVQGANLGFKRISPLSVRRATPGFLQTLSELPARPAWSRRVFRRIVFANSLTDPT